MTSPRPDHRQSFVLAYVRTDLVDEVITLVHVALERAISLFQADHIASA